MWVQRRRPRGGCWMSSAKSRDSRGNAPGICWWPRAPRPANIMRLDGRRSRPRKYSTDTLETLKRVWMLSGCECGPYLACDMRLQLTNLEANGELVPGKRRYSPGVRAELEAMSGGPRSTATCQASKPPTVCAGSPPRGRGRCCVTRSRSAEPLMRLPPNPGSSRSTRSRTADRR